MTIHDANRKLQTNLQTIYDPGEAANISNWVIEYTTGFDKAFIARSKDIQITGEHMENIEYILARLLNHEPVQYVLEEAWFYGMKFWVNKNVLIPRPETEELVEWVIKENKQQTRSLKILDVGTGSGCIPIALKKHLPAARMWSVDSSSDALEVSRQNAGLKKVEINFLQLDFLGSSWNLLPVFDIIISNPPYVTQNEKSSMRKNVLNFEPHEALFVPEDDPLVFYKAIAEFGQTHLNSGGKIYCELNAGYAAETRNLFVELGYRSEIKLDMQGKERFIKCSFETLRHKGTKGPRIVSFL